MLRDIVTLSKVTIQQDVLTFHMFNRSDVEDEGEVSARWLLQLLGLNSIKILKSLHYLVNFANNFYLSIFLICFKIGEEYNDCFAEVACALGF